MEGNKVFGKFRRQRSGKRESPEGLWQKEVVNFVHGLIWLSKAPKKFPKKFIRRERKRFERDKIWNRFSEILPLKKLGKAEGLNVVDLLVLSEAVSSKRQAREDVQNGAIELNGKKISDLNYTVGRKDLLFGQYIIAKRGKRDYKFISR